MRRNVYPGVEILSGCRQLPEVWHRTQFSGLLSDNGWGSGIASDWRESTGPGACKGKLTAHNWLFSAYFEGGSSFRTSVRILVSRLTRRSNERRGGPSGRGAGTSRQGAAPSAENR